MRTLLQEARATLALATPIIVGQVSQMLMGVTDSIMIGHVGKVPLAASAFANTLFGFVFLIGVGLLAPVAVLISRAHGAQLLRECDEWLRHGVAMAIIISAVITPILLLGGSQLHRFGQPAEVLAEVHPYFELIACSLLPAFVFQVLRQYSESLGRTIEPMVILLAGVVLNVVLNWILIYGNLGAPRLGLTGAGWATLVSRFAGVLVIALWLHRTPAFASDRPSRWWAALAPARFRVMLDLGVPAALGLMFEGGAFTAAALMMGWLGATELAAHQIALSCAGFTFQFPLGISMAVSIRIGRAVGQNRVDSLRPIGLGALAMGALVMGAFAVVFVLAGTTLASWFVTEGEVIGMAARLLIVAALFQLADGSQVISAGALRGLTDVKIPTVITGVAYWVVALPGAWLLGIRGPWGAVGIWAALAIGLGIAAILLIARLIHRSRADRNHPFTCPT